MMADGENVYRMVSDFASLDKVHLSRRRARFDARTRNAYVVKKKRETKRTTKHIT